MIQAVVTDPLVTLLRDMPEDAAHELVMMQGAGHLSVIPMFGIAKSDAPIDIKLDLLVLEGAAFNVTGQVGNDPFTMRVGFTEMGTLFDPGCHFFHQPLEVFLFEFGR